MSLSLSEVKYTMEPLIMNSLNEIIPMYHSMLIDGFVPLNKRKNWLSEFSHYSEVPLYYTVVPLLFQESVSGWTWI